MEHDLLVDLFYKEPVALDPIVLWRVGSVDIGSEIQLLIECSHSSGLLYIQVVHEEEDVLLWKALPDLPQELGVLLLFNRARMDHKAV